MRRIRWLHISDFHVRVSDAWSRDVVLRAMCQDIERQRTQGTSADFILATGDLAFSGKDDEYALAAGFFDALSAASGVAKERIFCIPGNHDIDRERQGLCFLGARKALQNQNRTDAMLAPEDNLETLLRRQESFRNFQRSYFSTQTRNWTDDSLGYVSRLTIEDVRLAIVALDSAWLAEGGVEDHGKLLIGERQVINAITMAQESNDPPHIIVAMAHHPLHLLQEFDRRPVQDRIERACHFFHCGHFHAAETRTTGFSGNGCLTLAAGASFETRQSHNSYSLVMLDLLRATRTVNTIQYSPSNGAFSFTASEEYSIDIAPVDACGVAALASAMGTYRHSLLPLAHYLSALLLDQKAELLIPAQNGFTFGSFAVLQALPDSDGKRLTADFMVFRNVLRVLYKRVPITDIFVQHGNAVGVYGDYLEAFCNRHPSLKPRLESHESDARLLAISEPTESYSHTVALLDDLATAQEWALLRDQSQRHVDSPNPAVAIQAQRMLAMGLARSEEPADNATATALYRSLTAGASADASDAGNLATLLLDAGNVNEAKATVLGAIEKFPSDRGRYLCQIGQRIVEVTGDRAFRKQLEAALAQRGKRD